MASTYPMLGPIYLGCVECGRNVRSTALKEETDRMAPGYRCTGCGEHVCKRDWPEHAKKRCWEAKEKANV